MHSSLLTCSTAICPDPPEIDGGTVNVTGNCVGDTAHYTCDDGLVLTGSPYLTCEKVDNYTAEFRPAPPECLGECYMNAYLCLISCVNVSTMQKTISARFPTPIY